MKDLGFRLKAYLHLQAAIKELQADSYESKDLKSLADSVWHALTPEDRASQACLPQNDIRKMIRDLLLHPSGCSIDLFRMLSIHRNEDGSFTITESRHGQPKQEMMDFADIEEAISFFLERRSARQLGFDFEVD